jgi:hypothetical protein
MADKAAAAGPHAFEGPVAAADKPGMAHKAAAGGRGCGASR